MSKAQERQDRLQLDLAKMQSRDQIERKRIDTNALKEEDKIEAQVFADILKAAIDEKKIDVKQVEEGMKIAMEAIRSGETS